MGKQIVYYSFISGSDYHNNEFIKTGPFSFILREKNLHPDIIVVQYSKQTIGAEKDIRNLCENRKIEYYGEVIDDISDFDKALKNIYHCLSKLPKNSVIYCNFSSGTVQLKAALVYLKANRSLHLKIHFLECVQNKDGRNKEDRNDDSDYPSDVCYSGLKKEPINKETKGESKKIYRLEFKDYKEINQLEFLPKLLDKGRFEEVLLLVNQQEYPQLYRDIDCLCSLLKGISVDNELPKVDYYDQIKDIVELTDEHKYLDKEIGLTWIQVAGYLLYQEQLILEKLYNIHNVLSINLLDIIIKLNNPEYSLTDGKNYDSRREYLKVRHENELLKFVDDTFSVYGTRANDAHFSRDEKNTLIRYDKDNGENVREKIKNPKLKYNYESAYRSALTEIEEKIEQLSGKSLPRLKNIIESIKRRTLIEKENVVHE